MLKINTLQASVDRLVFRRRQHAIISLLEFPYYNKLSAEVVEILKAILDARRSFFAWPLLLADVFIFRL